MMKNLLKRIANEMEATTAKYRSWQCIIAFFIFELKNLILLRWNKVDFSRCILLSKCAYHIGSMRRGEALSKYSMLQRERNKQEKDGIISDYIGIDFFDVIWKFSKH